MSDDYRHGKKRRLYLTAKRKKQRNLENYNRCRKTDLPYVKKEVSENFENDVETKKNSDEELLNPQPGCSSWISLQSDYDNLSNNIGIDNESNAYTLDMEIKNDEQIFPALPEISTNNNVVSDVTVHGRRIVEIQYFFNKLREIAKHSPEFGCSIDNLQLVGERRQGLMSIFKFNCNMCNMTFHISSEETGENKLNANAAAVAGIMSIGGGNYNLEEFLGSLNIPSMATKTYQKYHEFIADGWEETAVKKMEEAALREANYAKEINSVDSKGIPVITVVADGCWSKRSYRKNYTALSGAAAIIGDHFKEVLYIGIKNKFCCICARAKSRNEDPKEHICYKNYKGSSSAMESDILAQGFKMSMEMYNIKYGKFIADGDSSTYKKILECRPYNNLTVEKIECTNHLLRNFCNKMYQFEQDNRYNKVLKTRIEGKSLKLRNAVVGAVKQWKNHDNQQYAIKKLRSDITNSIRHIFGEHSECADYFCSKKNEENFYTVLKLEFPAVHTKLEKLVQQLALHARSLIHNCNSNVVEQFNSIVAKFVGGKRINYCNRRSYTSRCYAAVVSFNTRKPHYELHKTLCKGQSPGKFTKSLETRRIQKRLNKIPKKRIKNRKNTQIDKTSNDFNYGEHCQKPDLSDEELKEEMEIYLQNLKRTKQEIVELEQSTSLQADSGIWMEERRKILTASNFGIICKRRETTSCCKLVEKLLYKSISDIPALCHGRENEKHAIQCIEQAQNTTIKPCGLFIHEEICYLGATPDGIIDSNTLVEVKCPMSAYKLIPEEAIKMKKITFWKYQEENDEFVVNMKHNWYYQIQGQLNIAQRNVCIFGVWTGNEIIPIKIEFIKKDPSFWSHMVTKLERFYFNCMLPELVDPRYTRNMNIRDPQYITEAKAQQQKKCVKKLF